MKENTKKGRSAELVALRDAALVRRYYYWTEVKRLRFDDVFKKLSTEEFFISEERAFFTYAFAKSDRDNIDSGELRAFKADAKVNFSLTDKQINDRLIKRTLIEVL